MLEEEPVLIEKKEPPIAKPTPRPYKEPVVTTAKKASIDSSNTRDRVPAPEPKAKEDSRKKKGKESDFKDKQDGPMMFYTLNDRGEAESLDYLVERKKQGKKKKKKKKKKQRNNKRF